MDWEKELYSTNEQPLDKLVEGYSNTSIFRTIGFIGDSLSSGEFETHTEEGTGWWDMYEYSWGQYIARKNGLTAYNFSKGGMTAEEYINSFAESRGFWDKAKACQAYVVALGVNDIYNLDKPIGTVEDIESDNPTFVGYYGKIIKRYKEISPDAKFFLLTFPNSATPERDDKTLGMRDALYSLKEYFENCYIIDLYKYGPVYDEKFREHFYLHEHLNPRGYILTAKLVDSYIDYIVRHNPDDFRNTAFIGTDIKYK